MKKTWISTLCVLLSLLAMTIPSVPLVFGLAGGVKIVYYPYFSTLPIGYAVWTPLLSLILSVAAHLIWWAFTVFRTVHPIGWVIVGLHLAALVAINWDAVNQRLKCKAR